MRLKLVHRISAALLALGVVFWMIAGVLLHASAVEAEGSLTIICETVEGVKLGGMHWDIFLIGGRNDKGEYELQGDFAKYPVSLEDTSATNLTNAAKTLDVLSSINKLTPLDSADADANGQLKFEGLEVGLYLVAGDSLWVDHTMYIPGPFLLEITEDGGENQVFDWTAYPKYIYKSGNEQEEYTVKKIWQNDDNHLEDRSAYITVEIYRDGELYETVRLDESNDWTYTWSASKPYDWRVHEVDIPENYYVLYRNNETQYVIVNSYNDDSSITDTTDNTDSVVTETVPDTDFIQTETQTETAAVATTATDATEPKSSDATESTTKATETTTVTTTTTTQNTEKLPQTGQLWWPVPVMGLAGLVFITIGLKLRTKE